ncbi:MAG: right-handed parallel beta-helix repeat-containing protein [Nitrospirae bacterium]|nr:right-handed parallel beta-helix repeat-containing protein [Nitrospirota bacterium]
MGEKEMKKKSPIIITLFTTCLLITCIGLLPAPAAAQGQTTICTYTINTLPYTASAPGTYCLKAHKTTSMTSGNAITINSDDVVIDLNGFTIDGTSGGPATQAFGISGTSGTSRKNFIVRNGTVKGFLVGVSIINGGDHLVEGIHADQSLGYGISIIAASRSIIRNNIVTNTGGYDIIGYTTTGIFSWNGRNNVIVNNDITNFTATMPSSAFGINVAGACGGTIIEGNRIGNLTSPWGNAIGIYADGAWEGVSIINNRLSNLGYGIWFNPSDVSSKYRDNVTIGVNGPYMPGGIDIGNNN